MPTGRLGKKLFQTYKLPSPPIISTHPPTQLYEQNPSYLSRALLAPDTGLPSVHPLESPPWFRTGTRNPTPRSRKFLAYSRFGPAALRFDFGTGACIYVGKDWILSYLGDACPIRRPVRRDCEAGRGPTAGGRGGGLISEGVPVV